MYNTISDKCVGNLLGARKHGFVNFEGEMLYQVRGKKDVLQNQVLRQEFRIFLLNNDGLMHIQRRDEDTEITLAKPIEEIVKLLPITYDPSLPDNLQE